MRGLLVVVSALALVGGTVSASNAESPGSATPRVEASLPSGGTLEVPVGGLYGVPQDAAGVVLNVTVTEAVGPGFLTVWPCGQPRPTASNLNYTAGQTVPNAVLADLGVGGRVCIFTLVEAHVVVDLQAFFTMASSFNPLTVPSRIIDTRETGKRLASDGTLEVKVGERLGVPWNAQGVVLNVTVTDPISSGFLTVWPCGQPRPTASNVNYTAGQSVPNAVLAGLGVDGRICIYSLVEADVVVDVQAYFGRVSTFDSLPAPVRIADTRETNARLATGGTFDVKVGDRLGVPADAAGVVLNVTVTNPADAGFLTVWPCGQPRPTASNLNFTAGQTVANAVLAGLGTDGRVCMYSLVATDVLVDVQAYFTIGSSFSAFPAPLRIVDTRQ